MLSIFLKNQFQKIQEKHLNYKRKKKYQNQNQKIQVMVMVVVLENQYFQKIGGKNY